MAKQRGTDLDDIADNNGGKRARITDKINQVKFPEGKWLNARLFGSIYTYGGYWVKTKKKDGKPATFYVPCPSYDPQTQQRDSSIYDPWRDLEAQQIADEVPQADRLVRFAIKGYINGIVRSAEKDKPRKVRATKAEIKSRFKDKDSESWTPVFAFPLGKGALGKLKEQGQLNTKEVNGQTKVFPLTHEKNGRDVRIKYDSTKSPADQYQIVMGDKRTPMTDEQKEYLIWDLTELEAEVAAAEVKRDYESWATRNGVKIKGTKKKSKSEDDDDDDLPDDDGDDDDDAPKSKKGKGKKADKKKGKKSKSDDDDDDDSDFDDDDEDEDDEPKSKKGKGKKSKSKDDDDDDSDDDDDDDGDDDSDDDSDDDEDEDDEPKKKKGKAGKAKAKAKGKKSKDDDDDDEDDDDFDDDDDDDEPKSKKGKGKKKSKSDDDDDDDDDDSDSDDDDDDDDDEPKSKSKKSKAKGKGKKKSDDDDDDDDDVDDDDDFDDDDDDDDDEPKSKKSKSKGKKKSKK